MSAEDPRRRVPRTDVALADPRLAGAAERLGPAAVKAAVVAAQDRARAGDIAPQDVVATAAASLPARATTLRPVLNATGVVLHTNLGRASLSAAAVEALGVAAGAVDVEYDVADGSRARRGRGTLAALRAAVPDAEDVLVVNNGAAALVLATTALAAGRDVVVSRGEMVEIGDGFRLPDLIASTGARLREVGTTNRTYLRDYADAVGPDTGCVLKVHPSNFRVEGFTSSVDVAALATLGVPVVADTGSGLLAPCPLLPDEPDAASALRAGAAVVTASGDKLLGGPQAGLLLGRADAVGPDTGCVLKVHPSNFRVEGFTSSVDVAALATLGVPVVADTGSGLLTPCPMLPDEPDAASALRAGAAVVTASGDKLLGGPQAGLLLGRADVVERLRRHPLARALRVDKLTLAALEATLRGPVTPTWSALRADPEALRQRCEAVAAQVGGTVVPSDGAVGGGGAPGQALPGWAVALPAAYAPALRAGDPCVVGRVERDRCLLDLRCIAPQDDGHVVAAVTSVVGACTS